MHRTELPVTPNFALMMVDDSDFDQMLYKRIIARSDLVSELLQFNDPAEALTWLQDDANAMPDLVLLDINMPGMNGFEFLEQATRTLERDMCPVIVMLTTSLDPADRARAGEFDIVHDFCNKPLTRAILAELVRQTKSVWSQAG